MPTKRHQPTLFTHPEHDSDDEDGEWQANTRLHQYTTSSVHSGSSLKSRTKGRQRNAFLPNSSNPNIPSTSAATNPPPPLRSNYTNIYNQFVRRYRNGQSIDDDPRNDPETHYYQRGFSQLLDGPDSDDEDVRGGTGMGEPHDRMSALILDTEPIEPQTLEDRERLEWQTMLASVLAGDVLKSENTRIAVALNSSSEEENNPRAGIWLGIRARFHGRSVEEERRKLEERRLRTVDSVIREIMNFRVQDPPPGSPDNRETYALQQVNAVLRRLEIAHSLYPSLRAFYVDYPAATDVEFQSRCDTLNTWSTVITSLRQLLGTLRKWTGSESMNVTQPSPTSHPSTPGGPYGDAAPGSGTTFVERLLKEEGVQRQFEKGSMTTIHALVGTTRDAHVNLAPMFRKMNLPSFEQELVPLVSFLTDLAQAVLRVRLAYAQKLKNPDVLIIEQMTDDLKVKIGFACTLKRQYEAFLIPDPGGNWKLPPCISADYDSTILEALTFFFKLIHWKLKSGAKGIHFKETDIIETQWATFSDVSLTIPGGASLVAEQLCALTNKLIVRVTNYFDTSIRVPGMTDGPISAALSERIRKTLRTNGPNGQGGQSMQPSLTTGAQPTGAGGVPKERLVGWYSKVLEGVKQRSRKLQRLARVLSHRFCDSAEYDLEDVNIDLFIATLVESDHFLVYTQSFEEDGTYIVAHPSLRDHPDAIRRLLVDAFHVNETDESSWLMENGDADPESEEDAQYLLILSPRTRFLWNGLVLMLQLPKVDLHLEDNRVRLIADGSQHRLAAAKRQFSEFFMPTEDEETGEQIEPVIPPLTCLVEQQAHLPSVNRELRKITRATNRLAESIVDSVNYVRQQLRDTNNYQELLENWYVFASDHGAHVQKHMDASALLKYNEALIKLAISWVSFICDDCDPNDRKTFRWAVSALEFTLHRTRRNNILHLPDDQFEMLRQKVASCMTLLISHFDILGARSALDAKREKERQEELLRQQASNRRSDEDEEEAAFQATPDTDSVLAYADPALRAFWDKATVLAREIDEHRAQIGTEYHIIGRVLDERVLVDRSVVFLAGSASNVSIRWQQRRFIGAGSFGSVYLAINLDSNTLMAVKEIKFQETAGLTNLYSYIRDELQVMEMLHHPNVVEYYGIEVHRDKVYIFEEYCQGGSLAALLEHGRIEDEGILQVYTLQMLEGLAYLHSQGVVHRDIKPDNILLDHMGVIKYVDFGAAKIIAKNQRTMQRSRRIPETPTPAAGTNSPAGTAAPGSGQFGMNNSLTGTPMYMSPEVIRNNKRGRHGAMDIWSLGCVVLECATGRKPWSNLDNEWAIMFHIGVATQHPPLPDPGQLSEMGIDFIRQCLTIDPAQRPTAIELMDHPWMLDFREKLHSYEEAEKMAAGTSSAIPAEGNFDNASVARQAAILQEQETERIQALSPDISPLETPSSSSDDSSPGLNSSPDPLSSPSPNGGGSSPEPVSS
ncbi:kinase [Lentinus tigrinus ALCF2SS1-6]|uniref:Kinase n=1 Tax=Lentinus tigrinus ALCF2SS1-6 TaxID=1328759 RepID=A0A5C2SI48_9APHY|nr:kinase [Lentinus tigrinus ALCF2SS1-6]